MARGFQYSSAEGRKRLIRSDTGVTAGMKAYEVLRQRGGVPQPRPRGDANDPFTPVSAGSEFKNDPQDIKSFGNVERTIRTQQYEWGGVFDGKTGRIIDVLSNDSENSVNISDKVITAMRALKGEALFTHNHPGSSSFSTQDINLFIGGHLREMRIVSDRFIYSLADPTGSFKDMAIKGSVHKKGFNLAGLTKQYKEERDSRDYKKAYVAQDIEGQALAQALKNKTDFSHELRILETDFVNSRMFKKWGLTYTKIPITN